MSKMKIYFLCASLPLIIFNWGCSNKKFEHQEPLIQNNTIKELGEQTLKESSALGPKPKKTNMEFIDREPIILSIEEQSNNGQDLLGINSPQPEFKQRISLNVKNVEFRKVMDLFAEIADINILVGEDVEGVVTTKLDSVPWDKAFQAIIDIRQLAINYDVTNNLIIVQTPSSLIEQQDFKSQQADKIQEKILASKNIEPLYSHMYRLYYLSPDEAKSTIDSLFEMKQSGEEVGADSQDLSITTEANSRSIIARGKIADLEIVKNLIKRIDVKTDQVLIEAFIVEVGSDFERQLGTRLGYSDDNFANIGGGTTIEGIIGGAAGGTDGISLGANGGSISNFPVAGATSGIGIIRSTSTFALKAELTALESEGVSQTISNPKIFTLNNQSATITQGEEVPYESTSADGTSTAFKEAALKLEVTPSVIGDGNILLDLTVNNDTVNRSTGATEPPINKMEIDTKLLVADGDIVVIGGIKKDTKSDNKNQVPGIGDTPIFGDLFKNKAKTDNLNELLIFIAPKVL